MSKKICAGFSLIILLLIFLAPDCDQQDCDRRKLPDLMVDSITIVPSNQAPDDRILFEAVIKNNGTGAAPSSEAAMRIGGETYPQKFNVPVLLPGAVHNIQRIQPPGVAQNDRVTVYADYSGIVTESDETNNRRYKCFRVD